jgi:hypothetical protein
MQEKERKSEEKAGIVFCLATKQPASGLAVQAYK